MLYTDFLTHRCILILAHRNYTIRFMPMPIIDAAQALRASPDKTEDALLKVRGQGHTQT